MESWKKTVLLTASVFPFVLLGTASALPTSSNDNDELFTASNPFTEMGIASRMQPDLDKRDKVPLRILSVGASIMSGTGSTTGNGCRKPLRDALRLDGYDVDMVGSLFGGTMEHEAVPGDVLTQVLARVPHSTGFKPNIVIINAGTNDANDPVNPSTAGDRMNNILSALWGADGMSETCIMLSTLIPTTNANGEANQGTINDQYRALVTSLSGKGQCIYLAEMWPEGEQWLQFDTDYLATESPHVHPNDAGHAKMASVFYNSIYDALDDNKVVTPGDFSVGPSVCDKDAGTGVDAGGLTQRGSGYDDGIYYHDSEDMGVLWTADSDWDRGQWKFARLFDQNYDDLVAWINETDTSQTYAVWANSGDGNANFTQVNNLEPDLNCQYTSGVNFIDMTGDGLDDLVYIDADGNAYLSVNQGDGDRATGKTPTFVRVSDTALIKETEGYSRENVVLADIDGDGRGDYGVVDSSGNVFFWRNGWIDPIPKYWQALGQRFTGRGLGDVTGTRFEDINGDGRDDWLWLDQSGVGYIETNARSCLKGVEGDGLNVAWRDGFYTDESSGAAYKGMGQYVTKTETELRDRVHFARIYGQATIFGNLPLQDYVFMQHTSLYNGKHQFQMRVWKNTGGGGTKLKADGNMYCNMMGHAKTSLVDYVWAYSYGTMEMWANRGKVTISDSDPDGYWDYQGTIWTPPENLNRRDLHLADWDGDGACDIIHVNPDGGAVQVWLNNYPSTGKWDWTYEANPAPTLSCSEKRGLGIFDLAVRFADISGNGRADYLCIQPDSTVTGFIQNSDGTWDDVGQIKVSIGYDRANIRWADVNGDGADDLLWIEKFSGDSYVWYNAGPGDPANLLGSSYAWTQQDEKAYAGNSAGTCEYWPDLDGNSRADEHFILGTFTNQARTALNPSCGLQDVTGDDAVMANVLPTVPGAGSSGSSSGSSGSGSGSSSSSGSGGLTTSDWERIAKTVGSCNEDDPGSAWRCLTCNNSDGYMNTLNDKYTIWMNSGASDSIGPFVTWYLNVRANGTISESVSFAAALAAFYNYNTEVYCLVGQEFTENCLDDLDCNGEDYPLAAVEVMSSYKRFYQFYQAWWDTLDVVLTDWQSLSTDFVNTFVSEETNLMGEMDEWLLNTVLEGVSGPIWDGFSKSLSIPEDSKTAERAQEVYSSAYSSAQDDLIDWMGLTLDEEKAKENDLAALSDVANWVIKSQKNAVAKYANGILNGTTSQNVSALFGQINYGTWMQINNVSTDEIRQLAKKMTMATLIPYAWKLDGTLWPVIVVSNKADDTSDPFIDSADQLLKLDSKKATASRTNYDGKTFWLLGMRDCQSHSVKTGDCEQMQWETVPGYDALDGSGATWGNLTLAEMIESSWLGYKANGYANGYNITAAGNAIYTDNTGAESEFAYVSNVTTAG